MWYYFWRVYKNFEGEILAIPGRVIIFFGACIAFFMVFIPIHPYALRTLILASIFAIYAASWDLLFFTGQINLGHGAFLGIAAYITALLDLKLGLPIPLGIILGALGGLITGLFLGIPALRLRGPYLAIVTLTFPVILTGFVFAFPGATGGELGLSGISPISKSPISTYYICLIVMVVSILIMWKLSDTESSMVRTGIIFKGIAEDEIAARTLGINTIKYKLLAFSISGFFAGVAGGLYAHYLRVVGPSTMEFIFSIYPLIWAIFGGVGSIVGAVIGTYILYSFSEVLLVVVPELKMIIFTALIVIMILFMPEGITHWVRDKIERTCPRCKLTNAATRKVCRACNAPLH